MMLKQNVLGTFPGAVIREYEAKNIMDSAKQEIFTAIGDLSKLDRLFSARVLVATYLGAGKTKGGIILTQNEQQEGVYQGSVGLVLKIGPTAFKDDDVSKFHGQSVSVGEWVVFRPGDSKRVQLNGVNCRIVEDTQIDMVVSDPTCVTHRQTDVRVK